MTELTLHLHAETDKAILVSADGERRTAVWLPLSLIEVTREEWRPGAVIEVECPEWLATREGLI